jgi:AraC-like DNA-binding protein
LAQDQGIDPAKLLQPQNRISTEQHRALLKAALAQCSNTALGLELGRSRSMATLDQLAYLMMSSATLRASIEQGLKYQNYPGRFSGFQLITAFSEINQQGCYQIHAHESLGELRLFAIEELLAAIVTTTQWVTGRAMSLIELKLDYPAPTHADRYSALFDCPIRFDCPATQLFFDADILDQPLPNASPQSAALYAKLCEQHSINASRGDMAGRVWQVIVEEPAQPPSLAQCAERLHCSPRTLSRKLQAQGWQYQQLVDQVREIHARRYLCNPTTSITEVGHQLGYADSSSFHRAFKKWTGLSPSEYRRQLLG